MKSLLFCLAFLICINNFIFPQKNKSNNYSKRVVRTDTVVIDNKYYQFFTAESIYVVKKGDWLSKIALNKFNSLSSWKNIYETNISLIKNPDLILPGQKIKLLYYSKNYIGDVPVPVVAAKPLIKKKRNPADELELGSIVVNETITKAGNDFFETFYNKWEFPQLEQDFNITVAEKASPSLGTQIIIKVNDIDIINQNLQPRSEYIEDLANYCVDYTMGYLFNYEEIQAEMNGKDLKGSGIY